MVGRGKDIHPVMYALAAVSIGLLLLEHLKSFLEVGCAADLV